MNGLTALPKGISIARGEGNYPELNKDSPHTKWIAVKLDTDNTWTIFYGIAKYDYEYIRHNCDRLSDDRMILELVDCTSEVFKLYQK